MAKVLERKKVQYLMSKDVMRLNVKKIFSRWKTMTGLFKLGHTLEKYYKTLAIKQIGLVYETTHKIIHFKTIKRVKLMSSIFAKWID
jgi:hypothetical protein